MFDFSKASKDMLVQITMAAQKKAGVKVNSPSTLKREKAERLGFEITKLCTENGLTVNQDGTVVMQVKKAVKAPKAEKPAKVARPKGESNGRGLFTEASVFKAVDSTRNIHRVGSYWYQHYSAYKVGLTVAEYYKIIGDKARARRSLVRDVQDGNVELG
jgi:hypothetical protein